VDEHSIERIREAQFSSAVRGYDRGEVDRFLAELADWLQTGGGEDAAGIEAVRLELERVGEQTANILTEAHAAAQAIRDDASAQVRQQLVDANLTAESLRNEANEYAADTRDEADSYARKVRSEADTYGERARTELEGEIGEDRAAAQKEIERLVGDANRRKAEIEKLIGDLEQRRDAVIAELERLASGIAGTATEHRPQAQAAKEKVAEAKADRPSADPAAPGREAEEADGGDSKDTEETTLLARDAT
jgi:DivIVA domain-containing protein